MIKPDPSLPWPIAIAAVALIADREQGPDGGPALTSYLCPTGHWTLGLGETDGIGPGMTCTEAEAWQMLLRDLIARTRAVQAMLTQHATPNQLGALVSLAYNIGLRDDKKKSGLYYSCVRAAHNRGDFAAAAAGFRLYNKGRVKGQLVVLGGLVSRRAEEAALYLRPEPDAWREPMPQAVAPEPSLMASPTVLSGAATTGAGAIGVLAEVKEQLGPVGDALTWGKGVLADLGFPPEWVLPCLALGLGALILWRRYGQRLQGAA
jgi:lysozyme